jgi:RNA polymerase sigma factor (TIGR02999 family)
MSEITEILTALEEGEAHASEQLLPLVYDELRALAAQRMSQENPGQTLQATALVHDAYVRLVDVSQRPSWHNRGHFFAAAAESMRRILIENARRKKTQRHGGDVVRIDFHDQHVAIGESADIVALNEALAELEQDRPLAAEVVKLRYFCGLSVEQTASCMNVSVRTANRHWAYAKAFLSREISRT